jgi:sphingolipid delta-4 desaturase
MVVPYAMVFRDYHADHHRYQGWDGLDADLPTAFELKMLDSFLGKLVFLTFQTVFYAIRPMMVRAKKFQARHYANWIVCVSFGIFWGRMWGLWSVLFMIIGIVMAGTFNPASGHFVSEHYNVKDPEGTGYQETFSYYGPWNWMCFNVGYHNEHHDFPSIPWTRLPELRRIAAEFYDPLVQTESWFGTYVHFLFNPNVGMFSRVKRERDAGSRKGPLEPTDVKTSAPLAELLRNAGSPLPPVPVASVPTTAPQDKKRA